jgi:hypothetical protein
VTAPAQSHFLEYSVNASAPRPDRAGQQLKILLSREWGEELGLLDDGAHPVDDLIDGQRHLVVEDPDVTSVGGDQAQQHSDGRRLSRSVGTEEAVHTTYRYAQVKPVHCGLFAPSGAVQLLQAVRLDGVVDGWRRDGDPTSNPRGRRQWVRRHRP